MKKKFLIPALFLLFLQCQKVIVPDNAANTVLGQILRSIINPVPTMEVISLSKKVEEASTVKMGSKVINTSSSPRQITINNKAYGYLSLTESKVSLEGDISDFTLELDGLNKDISALGSSSFNLLFTPKTAGSKKITLKIANNSSNLPNFSFYAEGIATLVPEAYMVVSDSSKNINTGFQIDFGSKPTGFTGDQVKFTIDNFGSDNLTLSPLALAGNNSSQYGIVQPFPTTVGIDKSVEFYIQYRPVSVGDKSDTLRIQSNDTRTPEFNISLKAEATPGPEPRMALYKGSTAIANAGTYDFGNIPLTRESGNISFSILNNGSANLYMNGFITVTGTNANDFTISQPFPSFARPGEFMNFTINFIPGAQGARTASISIPTNDPTLASLSFTVNGFGDPVPAPIMTIDTYASGSTYGFGSQTLGNSPYPQMTFSIRNTGNATLSLTSPIVASSGDSNDFTITQPFPSSITSGSIGTFTVTFIPTAIGARSAVLTIATNDTVTPNYTINLTGTGVANSDTSPPFVSSPTLTYTVLSATSVRLNWNLALADDTTPQANLTYQVYCSQTPANVVSVASMNASSASVCSSASTNVPTLDITGLTANAGYSFNVMVRDAAFNGTAYTAVRMPAVTNVTATNANGSYSLGQVINIKVNFSDAVTVSGTPTLALDTGATVNYASGSGTTQLSFNYTIGANESSADLNYTSTTALTAGTFIRNAGNDASLFLPALTNAGSLGGSKNILVDTVVPTAGGGSGTAISFSTIQARNLTVNWSAATDNITTAANLQYKIVRSGTNITNLTQANAATVALAYTANITTGVATGLTPDTTYYFAVVVKDQAGNESLYTANTATTLFYRISLITEGLIAPDAITITNTTNSDSANFDSTTSSAILPTKLGNGDTYNLTATADPSGRHCVWVGTNSGTMPAANLTIRRRCFGGSALTIGIFVSTVQPININGTGQNLVSMSSGALMNINFSFDIAAGGCPGCVSPLVAGISNTRFNPSPHCGAYTTSTINYTNSGISVSGTSGAILYIRAWNTWDFCSTMESAFDGTQGQIIGVVIIQ